MFKAFAAMLLVLLPLSLLAQSGAPVKKGQKAVKPPRVEHRAVPVRSPVSPAVAVNRELSAEQLAVAPLVHVGRLPCELGVSVTVAADPDVPGHFDVHLAKKIYRMVPVVTSTGAIRLEDPMTGVVWLQLLNKSMLMNAKLGKRLVDACMNPEQLAVAQAMQANPGPSVLDQASVLSPNGGVAVAFTQAQK